MKLPRWLVISMLASSVLSVLAAAGWWWVKWPERTALELVEFLGDGNRDAARGMLHRVPENKRSTDLFFQFYVAADWRSSSAILKPQPRTWKDVLAARQAFGTAHGCILEVHRDEVKLQITRAGYKPNL
jgi:hypothetical protein